jgi:hypothetical protein
LTTLSFPSSFLSVFAFFVCDNGYNRACGGVVALVA